MYRGVISTLYVLLVLGALAAVYVLTGFSPVDAASVTPLADLWPDTMALWQQGCTQLATPLYMALVSVLPPWAFAILAALLMLLALTQLLRLGGYNLSDVPASIIAASSLIFCLPWVSGAFTAWAVVGILLPSALALTVVRSFFATEGRQKGLRWLLLAVISAGLSIWAGVPMLVAFVAYACARRWRRLRRRQWCIFVGTVLSVATVLTLGTLWHAPVSLSPFATSFGRWILRLWHDCYLLFALAVVLCLVYASRAGRWILERTHGSALIYLALASLVAYVGGCLFDYDPLLPTTLTTEYTAQAVFNADSDLLQVARHTYSVFNHLGGLLFWFSQVFALGAWFSLAAAFNLRPRGTAAAVASVACVIIAILTVWYMCLWIMPLA